MTMVRGSNPIWLLDDLTGNLFDDTFYLFVLQNEIPYLPATVWHDPSGNVPWTNPIRFLANGTLPVDIFFDPGPSDDPIYYRLEFRQGNTQADPLIYLVENYSPGGASGVGPITNVATVSDNEITNPQFSLINFIAPYVRSSVTNPDPIEVAPGWFLDLTGTGSVTVERTALNNSAGTINPTNAPYALHLVLVGWTTATLRQRFQQNGMLWANKTVSSSITARIDGAPQSITAILVDSNGTTLATVLPTVSVGASFTEYPGFGTLGATTNPNTPPAAYIDYKLQLPVNVDIYLTSFQLTAQNLPTVIEYQQDSINRQIDHTFNYFKDKLAYKPIPSYLVGWDFPLNPSQFFANGATSLGATGANKSSYVWDQTIAFQTVNNVLGVARNSANRGLNVTVSSNSSFALIQYLPMEDARELLSGRSAIQLKGEVSAGTLAGTVSLWWTNSTLPDIKSPNFNSLVSVITAGVPTAGNGSWVQVNNDFASAPSIPFSLTTNALVNDFIGFRDTSTGASDATFLAIVICFNTMLSTQTLTMEYCSLVAGDIPTRPAPQTPDEVLRECEYYYEKSYETNITPGTNSTSGEQFEAQLNNPVTGSTANTAQHLVARIFSLQYRTIKRTAPTLASGTLQFYTPAGTAGNVNGAIRNGGVFVTQADVPITNWQIEGPGSKYAQFLPVNVSNLVTSGAVVGNLAEAYITYQYVADVRLGVI